MESLNKSTFVVNCHNEWDPLESVIVGSVENTPNPPFEPLIQVLIHNREKEFSNPCRPREAYINANRELDFFIKILKSYQVQIVRPDVVDWNTEVKTPWWSIPNMYGCANPRDTITVIGKEIIEAGLSMR